MKHAHLTHTFGLVGLGWWESCQSNSVVEQIMGQRQLEKVCFGLVPIGLW